jgi:sugar lactone lactonase YvrE
MQLELVFYCGSEILEGPVYDSKNNLLYFVSITESKFYSINIHTKEIKTYQTNGHVGCVVIDSDGMLIAAEKEGIYKINPKTRERLFIAQFEKDVLMRYNDGKIDPKGRFIVGTMGYGKEMKGRGKLFSFDGTQCKILIENITISNGIAFSPNGKSLYYVDTPLKKVAQYDYNMESGAAIFNKYIIDFVEEGLPDGMCMDIDGMLWIAEWNGNKVCKWDPESGKKISEIILPCINVTSCCLGGENLEYLYITTAKNTERFEPMAGGLFRVKLR